MPIYFIRHGQSEFNATFDPSLGDPMIYDAPLTPLGRQQAIAARANVAALGIERVVVSPMTRAIETALHIFESVPPIEVDPRVRELLSHSCDVGRSPLELAGAFPQLSFDHISDRWWYQGVTNGQGVACEPPDVFVQRVSAFRDWLLTQQGQNLAIVGHGNLFKAMIGRMLDNCEIHSFEADRREIHPI